MSTVLHPVGPNPARVYWVRRIAVLLAIALVVAGIGLGAWAAGLIGGDSADAVSPGDDAAAVVDPSGDEADAGAPAAPVDCTPADLQLAVATDAVQYPAGVNPVLQVTVTNAGSTACTVDAGDVAREVIISSGSDRIWSTKDCAGAETASRQLLLDAGAKDPVEISWTRVRSAEACPADLPAPKEGTYQVVASLLGASSAPAVFALE